MLQLIKIKYKLILKIKGVAHMYDDKPMSKIKSLLIENRNKEYKKNIEKNIINGTKKIETPVYLKQISISNASIQETKKDIIYDNNDKFIIETQEDKSITSNISSEVIHKKNLHLHKILSNYNLSSKAIKNSKSHIKLDREKVFNNSVNLILSTEKGKDLINQDNVPRDNILRLMKTNKNLNKYDENSLSFLSSNLLTDKMNRTTYSIKAEDLTSSPNQVGNINTYNNNHLFGVKHLENKINNFKIRILKNDPYFKISIEKFLDKRTINSVIEIFHLMKGQIANLFYSCKKINTFLKDYLKKQCEKTILKRFEEKYANFFKITNKKLVFELDKTKSNFI
jgi:hypothetical protein